MKPTTYTPEFRAEAVKLVLAQGRTLDDGAKRRSVPKATLANWLSAARCGNGSAVARGGRTVPKLEAEIRTLRRELAESTMEQDVLKKPSYTVARGPYE